MKYYVSRDNEGKINGAYAALQPGYAEELLSITNKELKEFLTTLGM